MNRDVLVCVSRDGIGGSVTVALDLAKEVQRAGWSPMIVGNTNNTPLQLARSRGFSSLNLAESTGFRYRATPDGGNLPQRLLKRLFLTRAAIWYLKRRRPALIHVHDESSALAWAVAARRHGVPVIWHVHQQLPQKAVDWLLLKLVQHVIFVSDANRVRFAALRQPATTIYNGVNLEQFAIDVGKPAGGVTVGFISNLVARKRPEWAVRAIAALKDRGLTATLLIAGNDFTGGEETHRLQAIARDLGVDGNCQFLGFRSDVSDLLRRVDVLVLPSEADKEAFPRIIVEAMASGVPTVATRSAGIPDAVTDGVNGRLVDPESFDEFVDAVADLAGDKNLREHLGLQARQTAEKMFSLRVAGDQLAAVYASLSS